MPPTCRAQPCLPKNPRKAIEHLRAADPRMAHAIETVGEKFPLSQRPATLHLFCASIIGQSISMRAAETIVGRFDELMGGRDPNLAAETVLSKSIEELRAVGLNGTKAGAIHGIATWWHDRCPTPEDLRRMDDDTLLREWTAIRGIGPWTAKMFLIFGLRRPDVLPHEDLGVREGLVRLYGLDERPNRAATEEIAQIWAPWRTVGVVYVWQYLLSLEQKSLSSGNGWW